MYEDTAGRGGEGILSGAYQVGGSWSFPVQVGDGYDSML